jgi:cytochrome c2
VLVFRTLTRIWSFRINSDSGAPVFTLAWTALTVLLVVWLPVRLVPGLRFWNGPPADMAYSLLMAGTFLLFALGLALGAARPRGMPVVAALCWGALCYGAAVLFLVRQPDVRTAGLIGIVASSAGVPLGLLPYFVKRFRLPALAVLAAALAAVVAQPALARSVPSQQVIPTQRERLSMTVYRGLLDPRTMDGGAIEAYRDGLLVVNGDGRFYRLTPGADGALTSARLALPPPFDRSQFLADQENPDRAPRLRLTGMAIEPGTDTPRIFVAHQAWNSTGRCFTIRVSVAALEPLPASTNSDVWTPLFDSWPCLPFSPGFDDSETGGRLEWFGDSLLLTIGDHGFDGRKGPALAQADDNAYGKVIRIDLSGGHQIFSKGHRNAQGLLVDRAGRIWLAEHGPSGGDEINLLEAGGNYGWPLATYGTDYGSLNWPLAPTAHDHGSFHEPAHAFVPSVAVSNLIDVSSPLFPQWRGDLLLGSMKRQTLYRVRLRGDRVTFVEPIPIGYEIRDLVEAPDGRIVLWTDESAIVILAPGTGALEGVAAFERCQVCHGLDADGKRLAPTLRGIVGQRVAAEAGYDYSPALSGLGGVWTEERLDAFLEDPGGYAQGSQMDAGRVADRAERVAIIEFLKSYR